MPSRPCCWLCCSAGTACLKWPFQPSQQYPQGAGYSGDPARDLANGFTLAGPVYGDQELYLEHCFARATGLERWFLWCNGAGRSEGDKALWSLVPYGKGWVSDFSWNVCMERW